MGSVAPSGDLAADSWRPTTKPDRGHICRLPQSYQQPAACSMVPTKEEATQGNGQQKATLEQKTAKCHRSQMEQILLLLVAVQLDSQGTVPECSRSPCDVTIP